MNDADEPNLSVAGEEDAPPPAPSRLEGAAGAGAHRSSAGRRPGIALGDRVLAVGQTGEGKSEALAHLWAIFRGQRVLLDVQDHYELGPAALAEGALELDNARELDWRYRTIRYVPRFAGGGRRSLAEYDRLFEAIFRRAQTGTPLVVWVDEAEDVAPVNRVPTWVAKGFKQGRKHRLTMLAATQRPVGVERSVVNQATHVLVFRMVDVDDVTVLSYRLGMSARELADALNALPKHGYLRHTLGQEAIERMPPLPPELIAATRRHVIIPR